VAATPAAPAAGKAEAKEHKAEVKKAAKDKTAHKEEAKK
jgi:hypothetical protein